MVKYDSWEPKRNTPKKVIFYLEPDEDGYPPFNWETLWVHQINPDRFQIDNIPFFVRGISSGSRL
ncbi:MAG: hypothetical protein DRR08_00365 [Candidatus Parabeggiatoa sp. nov. 2]|nr:MAG: hypothetical protein DRR08_00365 [Gammaproteobacteria bacterium]HEC84522.1 DUF4265 domain-containing protein [Thioploca sp.]